MEIKFIVSNYLAWIINWGKIFHLLKTCGSSGYFCHTDHSAFFPQPGKIETELYPVKANQKSSAWHISWCNVSTRKWVRSHLRFFPVPISIHSSWRSKLKKEPKANTAISVSTVTINNPLNPLFEGSRACKSKRVPVSSWLKGWSADESASKLFERTSSKWLPWSQLYLWEFRLCW